MSLVALANCLLGEPMPRRFHAEPMVRATELLLAGARAAATPPLVQTTPTRRRCGRPRQDSQHPMSRRLTTPAHARPAHAPAVQRPLHVMVTNAGGGCSTCARPGRDAAGARTARATTGASSATSATCTAACSGRPAISPSAGDADEYEVGLLDRQGRVPPRRRRASRRTWKSRCRRRTHAEVRRVDADQPRPRPHELELTSYARGGAGAARAPTWPTPPSASCSWRRNGCPAAPPCSAAAGRARRNSSRSGPSTSSPSTAPSVGDLQYETDRGRFLGRGRTPADPAALDPGAALSGTTGAGARPDLQPAAAGAAGGRRRRCASPSPRRWPTRAKRRWRWPTTTTTSRRHARLRAGLGAQPGRAAPPAACPPRRPTCTSGWPPTSSTPAPPCGAAPDVLTANEQGQPGLWRHGISGDNPSSWSASAEAEQIAAGPAGCWPPTPTGG